MAFTVQSVSAQHIAVNHGPSTTYAWMVGGAGDKDGFSVYSWDGTQWVETPGQKGIRVAVDRENRVYIVNRKGEVWATTSSGSWTQIKGTTTDPAAIDVAVEDGGTDLYIVSTLSASSGTGNKVYQWAGENWQELDGLAAIRIAIDSNGTVWSVNLRKEVYSGTLDGSHKWSGARDEHAAGTDIAAALSPWVIGAAPNSPNGDMVYKKLGDSWTTQGVFAKAIAATKTGPSTEEVWIADLNGSTLAGP